MDIEWVLSDAIRRVEDTKKALDVVIEHIEMTEFDESDEHAAGYDRLIRYHSLQSAYNEADILETRLWAIRRVSKNLPTLADLHKA